MVFIYILNAYRKKYSSILLRKNLFNSLHFSFEKHVPFQVLKDFSISLLFLLFLSVFPLTDTNDSQNSREWRGNHHFSCFSLPLAREYSFSLPRFLPLLLNRSICNYQTNSWWDLFSLYICIWFAFSLTQLSRSYWLSQFKVRMWGFELVSNYHSSITKRTA